MAKKKAKPDAMIDELQKHIEDETRHLNDEEYIEVLESIEDFCKICVRAKREEQNDDEEGSFRDG